MLPTEASRLASAVLSLRCYFQIERLGWPVVQQLCVFSEVDNAQVTPALLKVRLRQACSVSKGRVQVVNSPPGPVQKVL